MISVDTNRLVKIWFSKPNNHPLGGILNELRLIRHRAYFPKDDIVLISNFEDFDPATQKELKEFCQRKDVNVSLMGLSIIEESLRKSKSLQDKEAQLRLLQIARDEIRQDSGCLAAASDIVRALTPITSMRRIYTDFDSRKVNKQKLEKLDLPFGYLISGICELSSTGEFVSSYLSNDIFVCDETQTELFVYYRKIMLSLYTEKTTACIMHIFREMRKEQNLPNQNAASFLKTINSDAFKKSQKDSSISDLFLYRAAAKTSFTAEQFDSFLTKQVSATTGPDALLHAAKLVIPPEFTRACDKRKIPKAKRAQYFDAVSLEQQMVMKTGNQFLFINEDDSSWRSTEDSRQSKLKEYEKAAKLIFTQYRNKKAKTKETMSTPQKEESQNSMVSKK